MTDSQHAFQPRTVAALYETPAQADAVVADLVKAGFARASIDITRKAETDAGAADRPAHEQGFWHSITSIFNSDDKDAHVYGEGVRRGGSLVSVHTSEETVDDAIDVLDEHDPLDLESTEAKWRTEGWTKTAPPTSSAAVGATAGDRAGEETIQVVEEELVVGKREVDRGNVRVRSFVREIPVSEQVRLHEENVHVERRTVDRPVTDADASFRERTIAMTEVNEEAVVGKTARVTEEIVVRKDVADRTETISDTVRKTEVEIDDDRTNKPYTDSRR